MCIAGARHLGRLDVGLGAADMWEKAHILTREIF